MNRVGRLALVLCLAALAVWGCSNNKAETGKDVLVTVNDEVVKTQDVQIAWNSLPVDQREVYNSPKGILTLLDEVVAYKLMEMEAENRKLDQDPVFKKRMDMFRQRLLVNALVEQSMSDADVMNYFQRNFLRARFIRAGFPENATTAQKAEARAKADRALAKLEGGTDFKDVMEDGAMSDLKPGENGELGYVTHQTLENMLNFAGAEEVFGLKEPEQQTGVLEGIDGFYILQLVEPPGKLDVRNLNTELSNSIRDEMREQVIRSLATELKSRKEFKITRNDANMAELMQALQQTWGNVGDGSTAAPASGATAEPAPAIAPDATAPVAGATPVSPEAPAAGQTVGR